MCTPAPGQARTAGVRAPPGCTYLHMHTYTYVHTCARPSPHRRGPRATRLHIPTHAHLYVCAHLRPAKPALSGSARHPVAHTYTRISTGMSTPAPGQARTVGVRAPPGCSYPRMYISVRMYTPAPGQARTVGVRAPPGCTCPLYTCDRACEHTCARPSPHRRGPRATRLHIRTAGAARAGTRDARADTTLAHHDGRRRRACGRRRSRDAGDGPEPPDAGPGGTLSSARRNRLGPEHCGRVSAPPRSAAGARPRTRVPGCARAGAEAAGDGAAG